jgi:hypothetical protein
MAAKPQKGRLLKAECSTCEMIVYLSRGAAIRHGMPSCACGSRMFFSSLEVQLETLYHLREEHPDFEAFARREHNRAVRETSHVPAGRMQCGGCNAFVPATNHHCPCGFLNDLRGNRNHGRWRTGSSASRVEMPF